MERLRRGKSVLDPYGAEDPVEFLAVAVEAFFEAPLALRRRHAELYAMLSAYFAQDPAAWDDARGLCELVTRIAADDADSVDWSEASRRAPGPGPDRAASRALAPEGPGGDREGPGHRGRPDGPRARDLRRPPERDARLGPEPQGAAARPARRCRSSTRTRRCSIVDKPAGPAVRAHRARAPMDEDTALATGPRLRRAACTPRRPYVGARAPHRSRHLRGRWPSPSTPEARAGAASACSREHRIERRYSALVAGPPAARRGHGGRADPRRLRRRPARAWPRAARPRSRRVTRWQRGRALRKAPRSSTWSSRPAASTRSASTWPTSASRPGRLPVYGRDRAPPGRRPRRRAARCSTRDSWPSCIP